MVLDPDFLVANMSVPCSDLLSSAWNKQDYRTDMSCDKRLT
jgi:hypothetical protein